MMLLCEVGEDYMDFGNVNIIFPNPSSGGAIECHNITIIKDTNDESNETFVLVWSSPDSQVRLPQRDSSTVIILANSESLTTESSTSESSTPTATTISESSKLILYYL